MTFRVWRKHVAKCSKADAGQRLARFGACVGYRLGLHQRYPALRGSAAFGGRFTADLKEGGCRASSRQWTGLLGEEGTAFLPACRGEERALACCCRHSLHSLPGRLTCLLCLQEGEVTHATSLPAAGLL